MKVDEDWKPALVVTYFALVVTSEVPHSDSEVGQEIAWKMMIPPNLNLGTDKASGTATLAMRMQKIAKSNFWSKDEDCSNRCCCGRL